MSQSVIICEGFYDRDFWAGWLTFLGCNDPGVPLPGKTDRMPIKDPKGKSVAGGHFAFLSKSQHFIRIVPCKGRQRVLRAADVYLSDRAAAPIKRLVVNIDSDDSAGAILS